MHVRAIVFAMLVAAASSTAVAIEDMDFVAEHLPEAAMDDRLLSLPVSYADALERSSWSAQVEALIARIESGNVRVSGPGVGLGLRRRLDTSWSLLGVAHFDHLNVSGTPEQRPVAPIFSESFPVSLPADATLDHQRGTVNHYGAGLALRYQPDAHHYSATFGMIRSDVKLNGYRVDYRITSGPDAGTAGTLDYSANYSFWIPFAQLEWRFTRDTWQFSPRASFGLPVPHRGWRGEMQGPGFAISGDTAAIGRGKHMGDPFAGLGLGVTYTPWHLTLDAGSILNQALLEPRIHQGVDRAWLMSIEWQP
jgi:hypothetical protein